MLVKEHKDDFDTTRLFFIKHSISTHSQIIKQGKQIADRAPKGKCWLKQMENYKILRAPSTLSISHFFWIEILSKPVLLSNNLSKVKTCKKCLITVKDEVTFIPMVPFYVLKIISDL